MSTRLVLAGVLAVGCLLAAPVAGADDTGVVQVTCWPGHRILLDDRLVGVTSSDQDGLWLDNVPPGEHVVRVERDGFLARSYTVDVPSGGIVEVRVEALVPASGSVRVLGPPGHRVYLDGRLVGLTGDGPEGLVLAGLEPRSYRIRVEKLGFEPLETTVEVAGGEELELRVEGLAATGEAQSAGQAAVSTTTRVLQAPVPAGAPAEAAGGSGEVVLRREPPRVADVLFGYRATGLPEGASVSVHREKGGPRAPVLVFWCVDSSECFEQTKPGFSPGPYRFRVTCRHDGASSDRFLELDARSGTGYLVEVAFADAGACTAEVREVPAE